MFTLAIRTVIAALLLACTIPLRAAGPETGNTADHEWKNFCTSFPQRCAVITDRCAKNPRACERIKQAAYERRSSLEKRCAENPERCEALKKRQEQQAARCKEHPEICRERAQERAERRQAAMAACEDFNNKEEHRQCMARRLHREPGNGVVRESQGTAAGGTGVTH